MSGKSIAKGRPLVVGLSALLALLPVAVFASDGATSAANVPWYLSRATGFVAYVLLFLTVLLGLAVRTKALDALVARWRVTDIHIVLSVLVLLFAAIHITVLLADTFIGFSVVQILIPFASSYEPVWTGIGVLTAYLLVLVAVSFPARRIIGYRAWRSLHYLTFLVYVGALVHGLFSGTDSKTIWAQSVYLVTAASVLSFVLYRIWTWSRREHELLARLPGQSQLSPEVTGYLFRLPADRQESVAPLEAMQAAEVAAERRAAIHARMLGFTMAAIGATALLLVAAAAGPFHWGSSDAASGQSGGNGPLIAENIPAAPGFSDTYSGTYDQSTNRRATDYSLHLLATGDQNVTLDVQLQMNAGFGASRVAENQAVLTDTSGNTLCAGSASALNETGFDVTCDGQGPYAGRSLRLTGTLLPEAGDRVQGTLVATVLAGAA